MKGSTMTETFSASGNGQPFFRGGAISRRTLLGGAVGAAVGVGLAGCSPGSTAPPGTEVSAPGGGGAEGYDGPPVELAFWNGLTGGDGPIMQKLIKQFNAEHANIEVSMTAIAWA